MSKHKSISRTIHVHKDVVHHRIKEEYNESQVLSEVYCKCGYKGSAKIEPLKEKWGNITWEEQKNVLFVRLIQM